MLVLVSYDVSTRTSQGRNRLRRVAKICEDFGQRVQQSVFECLLDPEQLTIMKARLLDVIAPDEDSLRFYFLGKKWRGRVEHVGVKPSIDMEGPLVL